MDHASGGPLLVDQGSGLMILIYHGERFADGDPADFWAFLGMAVSADGGTTFDDLGPIVTPSTPEMDNDRIRPVDVGPGGCVVRSGWLHLYYLERSNRERVTNLGLARAKLADVFVQAWSGLAPRFEKFHHGTFGVPALGGRGSDLLNDGAQAVLWFDVAVLSQVSMTLIVFSTARRSQLGEITWSQEAITSVDGVTWSTPQTLSSTGSHESMYLTIDSRGQYQRRIDGPAFDLYRVVSGTADRWLDARLERLEVRWTALDEQTAPSATVPL